MSVSLYYSAVRAHPLTAGERSAIDGVLARYELDRFVDADGSGGETFALGRFRDAADVLLEWSVGLPMSDEAVQVAALRYWLRLLGEVRTVLPDAAWHVHLDDWDVPWSEERSRYHLPDGDEDP